MRKIVYQKQHEVRCAL